MKLAANAKTRNRKFRFTLRTLLLIVSGLAVAIWWTHVPTQKASWFATEVNSEKSASALAMVSQFEKGESWRRTLVRHLVGGRRVTNAKSTTKVSIEPVSLTDIVSGRRRFTVVQAHDVLATDGSRHQGYSTAHGMMTHWGVKARRE
ncbi:MAG: hypothetical protein F9B45_15375 [Phycisphaera sp. RhM]|nr:hypothetical protein [Phycisphaera sp. RhM]